MVTQSTTQIAINGLTATRNTWRSNATVNAATPIHFAHGNGFPGAAHQAMLSTMAESRVVYALDHRATWIDAPKVPSKKFSWHDAADDLIAGIEQFAPTGVIGVGHSLGGVLTLLAAYKRPELFKQIILIEPVAFPTRMFLAMAWMPMAWRLKYIPLAKRTLRRQATWASRKAFVDQYASKPAFKGISLDVMADYAEHGLRQQGDQLTLTFPKEWEAHIFSSIPYAWHAVARLKVPCVIARAQNSTWVPDVAWRKWQRMRPDVPLHILPNVSHMAPMQEPVAVARWVLSVCAD